MPWNDPAIAPSLATVWNYMRLVHDPAPADAILTLGSFDPMAAVCAARLWQAGWAPLIVMSGGIAHRGSLLDTGWDRPEAEVFADIAEAEGVPRAALLLETEAQNTGQNFTHSRRLLAQRGIPAERLIVVAKPYMTRRGFATGQVCWPQAELLMQCEAIPMAAYFAREPDPERTLQALIGDLHRIMVYPALGFQAKQPMPAAIRHAMDHLIDAGYGDRLLPAGTAP